MDSNLRFSQPVLFFGIAFVIGLGLMVYLRDTLSSRYWPLGIDVYPRWVGAHALWRGETPYSQTVETQTQFLIYGRPSQPGEDVFGFYYPAYVAVIMLPLVFLPVVWAGVVWSAAMLAILVTCVSLWSWQLKPRPAPLAWGMLLISGILYRPAVLSVINGQYGLFALACGALSWWLITRGRDGWAGIGLALATVKPSVALLPSAVILLWGLRWARWRSLYGFGIAMIFLIGVTAFQIGWWLPDFITQTLAYGKTYREPGLAWSPEKVLTIPGLLWLLGAVILIGIGILMLLRRPEFPWIAVMGALYLNLLLTPHTLEYDLTLLLVPLFWWGWQWREYRWGLVGWLTLVWMPWISWLIVMAFGGPIDVWWKGIWQFYPTLLAALTLLWLGRHGLAQYSSGIRTAVVSRIRG